MGKAKRRKKLESKYGKKSKINTNDVQIGVSRFMSFDDAKNILLDKYKAPKYIIEKLEKCDKFGYLCFWEYTEKFADNTTLKISGLGCLSVIDVSKRTILVDFFIAAHNFKSQIDCDYVFDFYSKEIGKNIKNRFIADFLIRK